MRKDRLLCIFVSERGFSFFSLGFVKVLAVCVFMCQRLSPRGDMALICYKSSFWTVLLGLGFVHNLGGFKQQKIIS